MIEKIRRRYEPELSGNRLLSGGYSAAECPGYAEMGGNRL